MDYKESKPNIELTDGKILLRPFKLEDAEAHMAGEDDEQVKWLSGGKGTLEGARAWIEKNQKYWEEDGPVFNFAIWNKNSNKLVGMVEANTDPGRIEGIQEGDANISYGLYPEARSKGYTLKAVDLMINFLKSKGIKRAVIRVNPENEASVKVAERLGFEGAGQIKTKNGEVLDVYIKRLDNPKLELFKQKRKEGTEAIRKRIVKTFSATGAVAIHQFGSITKDKEDALSDSDMWITVEDRDLDRIIKQRDKLYSEIGEIVIKNEVPQNSPEGGIYSMVIHETPNGLYHVDYYIVGRSKTKILPESLVIYGDDSLPREDWFEEQLKKGIKALNTPEARITDLITLSFIGIKYVVRQGKPFLDFLTEQYNFNRNEHFPRLAPMQNTYDFNTIRFILDQHFPLADEKQKQAINKIRGYLTEVEDAYSSF
jgi:RimJ/RimL family protein N-acetyltransferase